MCTLSESTKVASYLLWEETNFGNALDLWYCAENIAYFMESNDILTMDKLNAVLTKPKYDYGYVNFVRKIAFAIYLSTGNSDNLNNWYVAERLLNNREWCYHIIHMAKIMKEAGMNNSITNVRSEWIKRKLEGKR